MRNRLGVSDEDFYDTTTFTIVPMGFCYSGKGKTGDLPPRPEVHQNAQFTTGDFNSYVCAKVLFEKGC